jgi:hypothetical protein
MNIIIIFIILIIALSGLGTIWYLGTQATCKVPDTNLCLTTDANGALQVPYCADGSAQYTCVDSDKLCTGARPASCDSQYCDYKSKTWKCGTAGTLYSCVGGTSCVVDNQYGKYKSVQECTASGCRAAGQTCDVDPTTKLLPHPVTDGKTVYGNVNKPDMYGTYTYGLVGSASSCKLTCDSAKSTLKADNGGIWCDPLNDGQSYTGDSTGIRFPGDNNPYSPNTESYIFAYQNYDNSKPYYKFSECKQPVYKGTNGKCTSKCTSLDRQALTTDDNCNITGCVSGYDISASKTSCIPSVCTGGSAIPFASGYGVDSSGKCYATGCNQDPNDKITTYTLANGVCTGTLCTPPTGDLHMYTPTGDLGKCVQGACTGDSTDTRKKYNADCTADCTDKDSCKAFIGIPSTYSGGFTFFCTQSADRLGCDVVNQDETGWGGCGNDTNQQYGPDGNGKCTPTLIHQRARFNPVIGCQSCNDAFADCPMYLTDPTFADACINKINNNCGYAATIDGNETPEDAVDFCVSQNGNYRFSPDSSTVDGITTRLILTTIIVTAAAPTNVGVRWANETSLHRLADFGSYGVYFICPSSSDYIAVVPLAKDYRDPPWDPCWYIITDKLVAYMATIRSIKVIVNITQNSDYLQAAKLDTFTFYDGDNNVVGSDQDIDSFITCCNTGTATPSDDPTTASFPSDGTKCYPVEPNGGDCKWW